MNLDLKWKGPALGGMRAVEGEVPYLAFPALQDIPGLVCGVSTRLGGVSEGHLSSMNLSFGLGDETERVEENYRRIGRAIGFSPEQVVATRQVHECNVARVGKPDRGNGVTRPNAFSSMDGLVTDEPGTILAVYMADCVPVLLVDEEHRAVGACHSGWKGTVLKISARTVERMRECFGTDTSRLVACIGPSICQKCYTVNGDVARQFMNCYYYESGPDQFQLDLQEANRGMMVSEGIPYDAISMPDLCTACNPDFLFSHRASKGRRGTLAAVLSIREEWKHPRFGTPL